MAEQTPPRTTKGQAGGRAVYKKYGSEHLRAIGRKGGQQTAARHGREHMRRIGKVGFAVTVERHFGGDKELAINTLIQRGLMALDPFPANGAWTRDDVPQRYSEAVMTRRPQEER